MTVELTSQTRGGCYFDFGDGRGAVHESDLTAKDRSALGLEPIKPAAENESHDDFGEIDNG